jgi:predicted glycosyltransferase
MYSNKLDSTDNLNILQYNFPLSGFAERIGDISRQLILLAQTGNLDLIYSVSSAKFADDRLTIEPILIFNQNKFSHAILLCNDPSLTSTSENLPSSLIKQWEERFSSKGISTKLVIVPKDEVNSFKLDLMANQDSLSIVDLLNQYNIPITESTDRNSPELPLQAVRYLHVTVPVIGLGPIRHAQDIAHKLAEHSDVTSLFIIGGHGTRYLSEYPNIEVVRLPEIYYSEDYSYLVGKNGNRLSENELNELHEYLVDLITKFNPTVIGFHNLCVEPPSEIHLLTKILYQCIKQAAPDTFLFTSVMDNQAIGKDLTLSEQNSFRKYVFDTVDLLISRTPYPELFKDTFIVENGDPVFYSGYVATDKAPEGLKNLVYQLFPEPTIFVAAGGANLGSPLFNTAIEAFAESWNSNSILNKRPWVILVGEHYPEDLTNIVDRVKSAADNCGAEYGKDIKVIPNLPQSWYECALTNRGLVSITQAGQSTISWVNATGCPMVVVPYDSNNIDTIEQRRRADFYQNVLNRSITINPEELTSATLLDSLESAYSKGRCTVTTDLGGAKRIVEVIKVAGTTDIEYSRKLKLIGEMSLVGRTYELSVLPSIE